MRPIDQIILHCTGTPDGEPRTVADIDARDRARGLRRDPDWVARHNPLTEACGYHYLLYVNGAIASARHHDEMGAHAAGHNGHSIGVALVGSTRFSAAQWRSLRGVIESLGHRFPGSVIVGHGSLPGALSRCPGFSVADWLDGGMNPLPEHLIAEPAAHHVHFARAQGARL